MKKLFVLILFLQIYFYTNQKVFNQTDSIWNSFVSLSLVKHFDLNLNEYEPILKKTNYVNIVKHNNFYYNYYPIGISILSAPFLGIYNFIEEDLESKMEEKSIKLDKRISAILISISGIFFYLICFEITNSKFKSFVLYFLHSFCTLNFSVLTRGLWQHSGLVFLYSILFFLILRKKNIYLISIILFFSYFIRPTSALYIFFISIYLLYQRKNFRFLLLGIVFSLFYIALNNSIFNTFTHPYYDYKKVGNSDSFLEAILGNLVSPSRGIFFFSPIFLFSLIGINLKKKMEYLNLLDYFFIFIFLFHLILISKNLNWWGGHSFGYRLMSDLIPILIYFLIYYLKYLKLNSFFVLFIFFSIISFYIHYQGASNMNSYLWNLVPTNIDLDTKRLWDFKDISFFR